MTNRSARSRHPVLAGLCMAGAIAVWGLVVLGASVAVLLLNPAATVPYAVRLASPGALVAVERFEVVSAWPLAVEVQGMQVRGEDGTELFALERATIETDLVAGWEHGLWIRKMELHEPRIAIHTAPAKDGDETGGAAWDPEALRGLFFYKEVSCLGGALTLHSGNRTIEVRELVFSLEPEESPTGAEAVDPTRRTAALDASVRVLEDGKTSAEAQIRGNGQVRADRLTMVAHVENGRLDVAGATGDLGAQAEFTLTPEALDMERFTLDFTPTDGLKKQIGIDSDIHVAFAGRLILDASRYELTTLDAELPGILSIQGNATGALDALPDAATFSAETSSIGTVLELTRRHVPAVEALRAEGGTVSATLRLDNAQTTLNLHAEDAAFEYDESGASVTAHLIDIDAVVSPRSVFEKLLRGGDGRLDELTLEGALAAVVDARASGWSVEGVEIDAPLGGTLAAPAVANATVRMSEQALANKGKSLLTGALTVSADASWSGGLLEASRLEIEADDVGIIQGHGTWSPSPEETASAVLSGKGLDVAGLSKIIDSIATLDAAAWSPSGTLDFDVDIGREGAVQTYTFQASGRSMAFASADGDYLGEKASWTLDASGIIEEATRFDASFRLGDGQLLLSRFFLDAGANPVMVNASGRLAGDGVQSLGVKANIDGIGQAFYNGRIDVGGAGGVAYDGALAVSSDTLGDLYLKGVEEPFASDLPVLSDYTVSGSVNLDIQVQGRGADARAAGMLTLSQAGFESSATGMQAQDVEIKLPIAYGRDPLSGATQGSVRIGSAQSPLGAVDNLRLTLEYMDGALRVAQDISLPVLGGSLHVSEIAVENPYSAEFVVTCLAELQGVRFEELDVGGMQIEGHMAGDLGRLRLTQQRLHVPGALGGSFFGGTLAVHDMGIAEPLSAGRRILATIGIDNVHLEPLSQATGIGRITGRLDLVIEDLVIAYGQPAAFTLTAKSEKVSGVEQSISLKAVNSITVLGTGSSIGDAGVGIFGSFFKEFSYGEIGVQLSLRNDVFKVRGLIEEGGVEYLIQKPPLFGINVINRTPGKRVSFSDMLERLSRITAGGTEPTTQTEFGSSGDSVKTQGE